MFADKQGITCLIFFVATILSYVKDATQHCLKIRQLQGLFICLLLM